MLTKKQVGRVIMGLIIVGELGCVIDGYHHAVIMPWLTKGDVLRASLAAVNVELAFTWCAVWVLTYFLIEQLLED